MKKLVLASGNAGKLREFGQLLAPFDFEVLPQSAFNVPEADEPHVTFVENAIAKARHAAQQTGLPALADDSGLEVDALGGAPGVYSARYAGEPVSYSANNAKLLHELSGVANRKARFRCVISLCSPKGIARVVDGRCEGFISSSIRGSRGFGYDPLFVADGFTQTFAEMDPRMKNEISHRARALARARQQWSTILARELDDWPES